MDRKDLDRLWNDPGNYKWKCFYCCRRDPRVIVPKRPPWAGWTINWAHPRALQVTVTLFATVLTPVAFTAWIWPRSDAGIAAGAAAGILVMILYCRRLSKPF